MVTKEMTKASAERDRVTQVKRDRANARQLWPGRGRAKEGTGGTQKLHQSRLSLTDAVVSHVSIQGFAKRHKY